MWDCDGNHDLPENELAKKFLKMKFIEKCEKGSRKLDPWQRLQTKNRYFPSANWMITAKCNYNCLHCFNAKDNAPLLNEMNWEQACQILDETQKAGIKNFTITGGEPMAHKNFMDIIDGIYERGMQVFELNTNGHYINEEVLKHFKEIGCDPLIKISFDGLTHHDWIRNRKGAEEDTIRAIKLCLKEGFRLMIQMNVYKGNLDTLQETVDYLDELGAQEIRLIKTTEVPRWAENAPNQTLSITEYYDEMVKFTKEFRKKEHKISVIIWHFLSLYPGSKGFDIDAVAATPKTFRGTKPICPGNRGMVAIGANGNVYPCMQMMGTMDERGLCLGNVFEDGLINLLTDSKYLDCVCHDLDDLSEHWEKCAKCRWFQYCCGGCVATAWLYSNDLMSNDPFRCEFYEKGYYDKIVKALSGWGNYSPIEEDAAKEQAKLNVE